MSDDTPLLNLPLILPAQAQKHVTHNEALRLLDITVQLAVLDRDLNTPPATPQEGDRYIVGPAPTGAWAGRANQIAAFWGGVWAFVAPGNGWLARLIDESVTLVHQGGVWSHANPTPETLPRLGIATTPDATNRLAAASPATLLTHAGAGHQVKVNKAGTTDTASLLFQTNFSGRAEMGLAGSDAFALRVSANGTTFTTALSADPGTGTLAAPEGLTAPLQLRDATDPTKRASLDASGISANTQRSLTLPNVNSELAALAGTQTFTGNKTFSGTHTVSAATATFGSGTGNATYGLGSGTTATGSSKTINLGTGGATGSTTTIAIGPATAGATSTLTLNSGTVTLGPTVLDFDMGSASARATAIGIGGATGDGTNRLSVNSPGVLLNHAGAGIEATVNKATPAAQGMVSFKTAFSTRAQLGLLGNDDLALRVSADGATFTTALTVDAATARLTLAQPALLTGQSADPVTPTDGMLWHNSTTGHLAARIGGRTANLEGQQDIPFLLPPAGELVSTTSGIGGVNLATITGVADRVEIFPYTARADFSFDRVAINCTTAVAGALCRVVLYAADANGRPAALLGESPDLDCGTIGAKLAVQSLTLRQGRTYWLGLRTSSTATVSAWSAASTPDLNGGTTPLTAARKLLRRTVAWATAAPATWAYSAGELGSTSPPAIWLRVA